MDLPHTAVVEFSAACNLHCVFCPVGRGVIPREGKTMTQTTFDKVAAAIRPTVTYVYVGGYGEALLHPHFAEWVKVLKEFAKINLATNLTVLPDAALPALALVDDLSVSISGGDPETYAAMHGRDYFDQVLQNLKRLRRARTAPVAITYVGTTLNPDIDKARRALDDDFQAKPLALPMRELMRSLLPETGATRFALDGAGIKPKADIAACREMWQVIYFLADGRVGFCCYDFAGKVELGSIDDQTLDDIWNSEAYQRLRADHLAGRFNDVCLTQCSLP